MNTHFQEVADVLADERFLSWYFRKNEAPARAWDTLMSGDPALTALSAEAAELLRSLPADGQPVTPEQTEQSLARLQARLNLQLPTPLQSAVRSTITESPPVTPVIPLPARRRLRWMAAAAAVVILIVTGVVLYQPGEPREAIRSTYGQLSTNQLPDGSTLILNANSRVSLSKGWEAGTSDREVWLEGEAFFKVAKTAGRTRFIVHTGNGDVVVTGTQFNVRSIGKHTTVLLTEGSVTLKMKDGKEIRMKPGDFVELDEQAVAAKTVSEDNVLAWKENRMAFENTPFEEVASIISNHYGVKVTLGDEAVKKESITGIMKNNNLEELLKAIEWSAPVKIERQANEIIISGISH